MQATGKFEQRNALHNACGTRKKYDYSGSCTMTFPIAVERTKYCKKFDQLEKF